MVYENALVKGFVILSSASLLLQTATPQQPVLDGVGRVSLDAVLIAGVIALWKAYRAKDDQNFIMAKQVTETMTLMHKVVADFTDKIGDLHLAIVSLQQQTEEPRSHKKER